VDGGSAWFVFWRLTLPLITPYIILVTVFRMIDCLKVFDIIYATTKGGPLNASSSLQVLAYNVGIRWTSFGKGMAVLTVMWVICYGISFYLTKAWRRSIQRASGL
jgi:multiple sugar transport system permease protein